MKRFVFLMVCSAALGSFAATPVVLKNRLVEVTVDPSSAAFSVKDIRSGEVWRQVARADFSLSDMQCSEQMLRAVLNMPKGQKLQVCMELLGESPELKVTLSGAAEAPLSESVVYPFSFRPHNEDIFILPEHEGVGIPVRDFGVVNNQYSDAYVGAPVYNKKFRFYSGHDLSMTFWGYAGEKSSCMSIVETPDDATLRVEASEGSLCGGIEWEASRGSLGYSRTLRYVFFEKGGYNAVCKRYRAYAFDTGLLKTLADKSKDNPNVMKFARSAVVWIFSPDVSALVPEMYASGMNQLTVTAPIHTPGDVQRMNEQGILNGVYDCVRSVLETQYMDKVFRLDPCDVRGALPDDIVMMKNGKPFDYGWPKNGFGGKVYRTLDVCDTKQPAFAKARIDQSLETRAMTVRFYDTLTAFPWTECYDPKHPTTRSQVRGNRMSVLKYAAEDKKQVVGSEAGHIYAVPYVTYFEGMNHSRFFYYELKGHPLYTYDQDKPTPDNFREGVKVEYKYRLPLLELVAHDCVVVHTRWNLPNNKIHNNEWWDHMDLWDILYATPPMYVFINEPMHFWEAYKPRYLQSYSNVVGKVLSKVAGQEMTEHCYVTKDKTVQKTVYANGVEVVVNFGDKPFALGSGETVPAGDFAVLTPAGKGQ